MGSAARNRRRSPGSKIRLASHRRGAALASRSIPRFESVGTFDQPRMRPVGSIPSGPFCSIHGVDFLGRQLVVNDLSVDNGEHRLDLLQLFVADLHVVLVQNNEICKLVALDRAQLGLHVHLVGVATCEEADGFLARNLFAGIDHLAQRIASGHGIVHRKPRVQRSDMSSVHVDRGFHCQR